MSEGTHGRQTMLDQPAAETVLLFQQIHTLCLRTAAQLKADQHTQQCFTNE